jgi:hypothetical protein
MIMLVSQKGDREREEHGEIEREELGTGDEPVSIWNNIIVFAYIIGAFLSTLPHLIVPSFLHWLMAHTST